MAGSSFGTIFKVTTWGESHGKALGAVIDGCPSGLSLEEKDIQKYLDRESRETVLFPLPARKLTRFRFYPASLTEKLPGLPFPCLSPILHSVPLIIARSPLTIVPGMRIIPLTPNTVFATIREADVLPAGKPLAGLLPELWLQRS